MFQHPILAISTLTHTKSLAFDLQSSFFILKSWFKSQRKFSALGLYFYSTLLLLPGAKIGGEFSSDFDFAWSTFIATRIMSVLLVLWTMRGLLRQKCTIRLSPCSSWLVFVTQWTTVP